jgi:hypothetical protein
MKKKIKIIKNKGTKTIKLKTITKITISKKNSTILNLKTHRINKQKDHSIKNG